MQTTHAIGIDLGTTYSCIASLNEHGEPVTLPNQEGELSTPSVVLLDKDEVIVGTEALRNTIVHPERVVQNSKRFIGDPQQRWTIDGKPYTPVDIATLILKKLIGAAQQQLGSIEQAVITVPAQFSDQQRQATVEAGHRAGLQRVDMINEPVAAALCYVLGTAGLWFTELADEQMILVYDLGGGTFDLSLVRYRKDEVSVVAGSGDLNLGGIDWNLALQDAICKQFRNEFGDDPRDDPSSLQFLALEVEQTKRALSVRPRAALTCQHAGRRKTFQVEQKDFEKLTSSLVEHTAKITKRMLKSQGIGWAHIDVVLTTGGASRMPMIRNRLKQLSGTTLNTSISPDQSIAHGATYYAGMLLTNNNFARSILNKEASSRLSRIRQQSVNARGLGILVRDTKANQRVPHYLIRPNTPLPAEATEIFGTVTPNQRRVHLQIVESGITADQPAVKLGACIIDELPAQLPEGSEIAVTIKYDSQALVHVNAKDVTSGKEASAEIIRHENLVPQLTSPTGENGDVTMLRSGRGQPKPSPTTTQPPERAARSNVGVKPAPPVRTFSSAGQSRQSLLEQANQPVPLCNECGELLDVRGRCPHCGEVPKVKPAVGLRAKPKGQTKSSAAAAKKKQPSRSARPRPTPKAVPRPRKRREAASPPPLRPGAVPPPDEDEIIELDETSVVTQPVRQAGAAPARAGQPPLRKRGVPSQQRRRTTQQQPPPADEDEFWQLPN